MLEKDIQGQIIRYLRKRPQSFTWKQHAGRYARAGMPDVLHIERRQVFAFEVKQPGNTATALQRATLDKLSAAGTITAVVTSLDEVKAVMDQHGGGST